VVERVPPPLEPDPGWSNPWAAVLAGIVGLLAGGLLGYALRGNGESTRTTAGPALTRTVTSTVVHPKVVVRTNTVTSSTVTQTPSSAERQRLVEAEAKARKLERENEELRRQTAEGG